MHQKCDGLDKIKDIYCIWPVFHGSEGGGSLDCFHTSQEMSILLRVLGLCKELAHHCTVYQ